ncbi:MAG: alpha/beta fold hydrolase [Calditrichia bacterium]
MLLLHGGGSDYSEFSWRDVLKELGKDHRIYAPDFPGYGYSQWPAIEDVNAGNPERLQRISSLIQSNSRFTNENSTLLTQVSFLCAFIEQHQLEGVHVAGFSMGGAIAILAALTDPKAFHKVAVINSYGIADEIKRQKLAYLTSKVPFINKLLRAILVRSSLVMKLALGELVEKRSCISRQMVEDARESVRLVGHHLIWKRFVQDEIRFNYCNLNLTGELQKLSKKLAVIQTDKDRLFFPENARKAAISSRFILLPSAGHIPARECPEALVASLQQFFDLSKDF